MVGADNQTNRSPQPDDTILSRIDWLGLNARVEHEQKNRERYSPVISLYRWWARRSHSVMGAILDAAAENKPGRRLRVSDPFSGGGTVAFEAFARGLRIYAQDLYPWPSIGLATGLSGVSSRTFKKASVLLLNSLEPLRKAFRRSDGRELTHVLRVRIGHCPHCHEQVFLFPAPMVSLVSRKASETQAFFGCHACGNIDTDAVNVANRVCGACGYRAEASKDRKGVLTCPSCGRVVPRLQFLEGTNDWKPVLVQECQLIKGRAHGLLRLTEQGDPTSCLPASSVFPQLCEEIKDGVETRRLRNFGFYRWGDLYTDRQAKIVIEAISIIKSMELAKPYRDRLALAVLGMVEMPAFLSRWDRYHLKAMEAIANHQYANVTLVVETNPLADLGRGTLKRRFMAAQSAVEWLKANACGRKKVYYLPRVESTIPPRWRTVVATGDSGRQGLQKGQIDLVLTDPPYYDDVQYGELSRLFHFWLSQYDQLPPFSESEEAVPNRVRKHGAEFYQRAITRCLSEARRALSRKGRLVLTYHNKELTAWKALANALIESGFVVSAVAVVRAENSADHSKRDGKGILHDLVIECMPRGRSVVPLRVPKFEVVNDEQRATLAMGLALSGAVLERKASGLEELFRLHSERIRCAGNDCHVE